MAQMRRLLTPVTLDFPSFLEGGGSIQRALRAMDWSRSPLGKPDRWPDSLRFALRTLWAADRPACLWWGSELVFFYNAAGRYLFEREGISIVGRPGAECPGYFFSQARSKIVQLMRGESAQDPVVLLSADRPSSQNDRQAFRLLPIDDADSPAGIGGVMALSGGPLNRELAFEALERSEERLSLALEAGVVGTWDWHIDANKVYANERFAELYGVDPIAAARGAPVEDFVASIHAEDRERISREIEISVSTGKPFLQEYRLVQADGSVRWVLARGQCFKNPLGHPTRFPGAVLDITERKLSEQHRKLLAEELHHRVKNILTMIQSIAVQTMHGDNALAPARDAFLNRLTAFAAAQDALNRCGGLAAGLPQIVRRTIETYGDSSRFKVHGENLTVAQEPALILSLALHELATNAVKFGALSNKSGHVEISWKRNGDQVEMLWQERNGPAVSFPAHKSFGSRLLTNIIAGEMRGNAELIYAEEGLVWRLVAPALVAE